MNILRPLVVFLYKRIRTLRRQAVEKMLRPDAVTLLDVGCQELYVREKLRDRYTVTSVDLEPRNDQIRREDVQALRFENQSFDIVLCQQVLEHVPDPVKAMHELHRVARKQLILSVPYEPFFTFARLGFWEKEHLWAIRPDALTHHLGPPDHARLLVLKRYYLAAWNVDEDRGA